MRGQLIRQRTLLFIIAGCIAALPGCSSHESGGGGPAVKVGKGGTEPQNVAGKYGGHLTDSTISDPKTFNIWLAAETSSTDALNPIYEALNDLNLYTLKFEPRLADLPQVSADGLTYTYKLKEGLKWSDGEPITADDVCFTLDVLYDPKIATTYREVLLVDIDQPDGTVKREPFKYQKIDARTVQFILPVKWGPANSMFSFPIAPKHKLSAAYSAGSFNSTWGVNTDPKELVASGGWVIQEYVPRQRIVYKRNPNYWRKTEDGKPLPYMETWTTLVVPDFNAETLKFRSKDTDVIEPIQPPDFPELKKGESQGDYTVYERGPGWGNNFISFNQNLTSNVDPNLISLFRDVRFRRAVSHAVNRKRIVNDLFQGLAEPLYGPETPANTELYNPNVPRFEYDLAKAKALLDEIGVKDTNGDGIREYNGKPVKFNILTNAENEQRKGIATIISEDLRNIGLGAQFTPIAFNDLIRRLDTTPYNWDAIVLGFTGGPEPHSGSNVWRSSGRTHQWWPLQKKPSTPWEAEIDKLFTEGAHELDPAKRKAIYDRWQVVAAEQLPLIYTIVVQGNSGLRNRFGNVKPVSFPHAFRWNIEQMFDKTAQLPTP